MDFDTEKFILEVQSRPAIWKYNDKIQRYKDWRELAESHGAEGDEEVKLMALRLQKKWKNVRDSFVKTHKWKTGKASGRLRKMEYSFYEDLLFLLDSEFFNPNNSDEPNPVDTPSNTTLDAPSISDDSALTFELKTEATENDPLSSNDSWPQKRKRIEVNSASHDNHDDGDVRPFFLSLEKEFVKIPEHRRIQAKIDLLKAIMDARFSDF